jgi:GT2 family glycosyltransferase
LTLSMTELSSLPEVPAEARSLVVLMCAFNRRPTTLRALQSLHKQAVDEDVRAAVVLLDDGSTDGTGDAIAGAFPAVSVIRGDGHAFWARGMEVAQEHALATVRPDYLLWLNDDVVLEPDALGILLQTAHSFGNEAVVVGPVTDADSGSLTYSGYVRVGSRPTQLRHVSPSGRPQRVDTFNGNVVLVPRRVYECVGAIDGGYAHSYGDTDYGYRVASADLLAVLAPRRVGCCARNDVRETWRDSQLNVRLRIAHLISPKGVPPPSYIRFQRRHGGRMWLLNVAGRYASALTEIAATSRLSRRPRQDEHAAEHVGSRRESV